MENQWKIPMEFQGKPCGQAAFCREGLYLQVTCDCENVTDQVVRAYLEGPEDRLALGVLVPENGMLHPVPADPGIPPAGPGVYLRAGFRR